MSASASVQMVHPVGTFIVSNRKADPTVPTSGNKEAVLKPVMANQIPVNISLCEYYQITGLPGSMNRNIVAFLADCEQCEEMLEGACFEHTDVERIIYDKPPIPLAYSSVPDSSQRYEFTKVLEEDKGDTINREGTHQSMDIIWTLNRTLTSYGRNTCGNSSLCLAYDLSDDFLCNWIRFVRPSSNFREVNVIAYQQHGSIYLFSVRDIAPSTELRVFVNRPQGCAEVYDELFGPPVQYVRYIDPEHCARSHRKESKLRKLNQKTEKEPETSDEISRTEVPASEEPTDILQYEPTESEGAASLPDVPEFTSRISLRKECGSVVSSKRVRRTKKELTEWRNLRERYY
ncbi:hypothetical protein RvY_00436 [Ramazzottius varieornatus]|uniref:SET domain-containing protein n=1 Tax=Ramazzottius varieornatus TaxID=947166 RepID=A0A1D1UK41_RAMVA|nr:hypothetical protein RvY_00436 [Ramazzottius varieornatus]